MTLTYAERSSPVWNKIKNHYEGRLKVLRSKNDGALDIAETSTIRGRIAEVKAILALEPDGSMGHDLTEGVTEVGALKGNYNVLTGELS